MSPFPVHYRAHKPERFTREQVVVRLVAVAALGLLGLSLGALYVAAYLGLAAYAAARLSGGRDAEAYLRDDGARLTRGLRWFAAVFGWLGMVSEAPPLRGPSDNIEVDVEPAGRPTPASALWRIPFGLPSALALAVLGIVAAFVWLWSAIRVLSGRQVGDDAYAYLVGVQRWSVRLLAYQASLVDVYPPFTFDESPPLHAAPHAG